MSRGRLTEQWVHSELNYLQNVYYLLLNEPERLWKTQANSVAVEDFASKGPELKIL